VEQDVERALAVMDQDSGKMMTYCQLRKHPKFNKTWTTSSANEFGCLANGVGGRVKGTNTILQFIKHDDVPQKRRKNVTYGSFHIRNPVSATRNHNYCTVDISFWPVTISVHLTNFFLVSTIW
jgi:hypothetical protein